jgi:hypothetical protein
LDNANRANAEYLKQIKSLQNRTRVCKFLFLKQLFLKSKCYINLISLVSKITT